MNLDAKSAIRDVLARFGYDIVRTRKDGFPLDFRPEEIDIIRAVRDYTMTTPERLRVLIDSVRYVLMNRIPGAIVECGVWRGGSMMAAAHVLISCGETARDLVLFDVYDALMPAPTQKDVTVDGTNLLSERGEQPGRYWNHVALEEVKNNLSKTGYPAEWLHFVRGRVEDTLPTEAPDYIALLRLDTDLYESTRYELETLYPRLAKGGVLIIDDYGSHEGARQAVNEYFARVASPPLLVRIDTGGVVGVKR